MPPVLPLGLGRRYNAVMPPVSRRRPSFAIIDGHDGGPDAVLFGT